MKENEIKYLQKIERQAKLNAWSDDEVIANSLMLDILNELNEWSEKANSRQAKKINNLLIKVMQIQSFVNVYQLRVIERQKHLQIAKDKEIWYKKEIEKLKQKLQDYELNEKI